MDLMDTSNSGLTSSQSAPASRPSTSHGQPQQPSAPSGGPQVRSRITVVCAECKRLKLKCDRRTPCGSCTKRDTVARCIYSPAAAEKVDLHSLNNRLLAVEAILSQYQSGPSCTSFPSHTAPSYTYSHSSHSTPKPTDRAVLVKDGDKGGSSIIISLEDVSSLWLEELGIGVEGLVTANGSYGDSVGVEVKKEDNDGMNEVRLPPYDSPSNESFMHPLTPPSSISSSTSPPLPSHTINLTLVALLPPLAALAPLEDVLRLHPVVNWGDLKQRISNLIASSSPAIPCRPNDMVGLKYRNGIVNTTGAKSDLARAVFFGLPAPSPAITPPTSPSKGSTPTQSFFAVACASFALAGLVTEATRSFGDFSNNMVVDVDKEENTDGPRPGSAGMGIVMENSAFFNGPGLGVSDGRPGSSNATSPNTASKKSPSQLMKLSEQALATFEQAGMPFDLDFVVARLMLIRCALYAGGSGASNVKLDVGLFANLGKLVNIARVMGLAMDPDEFPGRYTIWEAEGRRRVWWDIYFYDMFLSDCMGQPPLISDGSFSTKLPADVDEDAFDSRASFLPIPAFKDRKFGWCKSEFKYFELKCRLAQLVKSIKKRTFRDPVAGDSGPQSYSIEQAAALEAEVQQWLKDLPLAYRLAMDDTDPSASDPSSSSLPSDGVSSSSSPSTAAQLSPILAAQQCELAITAQRLILKIYLPFLRSNSNSNNAIGNSNLNTAPLHQASFGTVNAAHIIIHASRVLHSLWKKPFYPSGGLTRRKELKKAGLVPAMFEFYSFGRALFDASVVCAHSVIRQPTTVWAKAAVEDVGIALGLMMDPILCNNRSGREAAINIVEILKARAERARCGTYGIGGTKRKFDEVEKGAAQKLMGSFELPYVGPGVVTFSGLSTSSESQNQQDLSSALSRFGSGPGRFETIGRPPTAPRPLERSIPETPSSPTKNASTPQAKKTTARWTVRARLPNNANAARQRAESNASSGSSSRSRSGTGPGTYPPLSKSPLTTHTTPSSSDSGYSQHDPTLFRERSLSIQSTGMQSESNRPPVDSNFSLPFGSTDSSQIDMNGLRERRFSIHDHDTHSQQPAYGSTPSQGYDPRYVENGGSSSYESITDSSPYRGGGSLGSSSPFAGPGCPSSFNGGPSQSPQFSRSGEIVSSSMVTPQFGQSSGSNPPTFGQQISNSSAQPYYSPSPPFETAFGDPLLGVAMRNMDTGSLGPFIPSPPFEHKAQSIYPHKPPDTHVPLQSPFGNGHDLTTPITASQTWTRPDGTVSNGDEYWDPNNYKRFQDP